MNLIPIAFELTEYIDPDTQCPILAATQELGLEVHTVAYLRQDVRTTSDPTRLFQARNNPNWWYEVGTNHRLVPAKQFCCPRPIVEGEQFISRDMEEQSYCLVRCTPEQLLALLVALRGVDGQLVARSVNYSDEPILALTVGD